MTRAVVLTCPGVSASSPQVSRGRIPAGVAGGWSLLRRLLLGVAFSSLTAVLMTLAFPPYGLWPLVFVGLVPMIVAQHRVLPPRLSGLAYAIGVGGIFAGYFGAMFAGGPWFMRALPLTIGLVAGLASARDRAFHQRTGHRWLVLQGACVWVGIEMIRGLVPVLGTWGFAAYALYAQPWLIQPVSVVGVYGLSLLVLLVNHTLGLGALAVFDSRWLLDSDLQPVDPRRARRWLWAVAIVLCAWVGLSLLIDQHGASGTQTVRVAAIQPGFRVASEVGLAELLDLTRQAADRGAELIVWHEGALPFDPQVEHNAVLQSLAAETGAHLVMGYSVRSEVGVRNEAVILGPDGVFRGPYGKDHPVAWSGESSVTKGPYASYATELGDLGIVICYDIDFTDTTRSVASRGAQLVAVPSFDWRAVAAKHYTHLVFRAVENRVAAVKADVAFDSAIIAPDGRILSASVTPDGAQTVLVADVPMGGASSVVVCLGDWVGWLALVGMVTFLTLDLVTSRRAR